MVIVDEFCVFGEVEFRVCDVYGDDCVVFGVV